MYVGPHHTSVMSVATPTTPSEATRRIGHEYVNADSLPNENGPKTEAIYDEIARKVSLLFEQIQVPVVFQEADPYDSYQDMAETVGKEQQLRIYNQHTDHEFFTHEEQLKFRAVHDWFGHLDADVDFSPDGEYKKWYHMNEHFTYNEAKVMFGEILGQVGMAHYLPDGFEDDRFEQRAFIAPDRWLNMMDNIVD